MIPVSLFNKNLPIEECNSLAAKVGSLPVTDVSIGNPKLPQMSGSSKLTDFIRPRSVLLFSLLGVSHKFLLEDDWTSERSLALATLVNGKMTRTESSYQELLVVEKHRKMFTLTTKEDLKKLL